MGEEIALNDRQMTILRFLELVGPSDEGDVAYGMPLRPHELHRVPPAYFDIAGAYIARRELQRLQGLGLVRHDGVVWRLTSAARRRLG